MSFARKVLFLFASVFVLCFSLSAPVMAQEAENNNFSVDLETTYDVQNNGNTRVSHHFVISNLNPTLFIKQYGLKLSSSQIENVVTRDNSGDEISTEVVTNNNQTSIGITFPDQLVGQNKARDFTISYTNPDIAVISGQVLEVAIPQQANPEEFSDHSVKVITPLAFGLPTRATPNDYDTRLASSQKIETDFSDLGGESVSLIFGNTQIFELGIRYELENTTNTAKITQIALPPDTTYQTVNYKNLDPLPNEIYQDDDGNWIATYRLEANSATNVQADISVLLSLLPDPTFPAPTPTDELISEQRYWPANNGQIRDIASGLSNVKDIYDYVVNTLEYDYSNVNAEVERLGALTALNQPNKALCQEFTDLFIAIARSKNIPTRRITGYSHTQNEVLRPLSFVEDVLHAWPEYYDAEREIWVPVDPTWENTSGGVDYFHQFDLNHITFAINGTSSTIPFPAGSYRSQNSDAKNIEVKFGNQFLSVSPDFQFEVENRNILGWPIPGTTRLTIFNQTGMAHYDQELNITAENGSTHINLDSPLNVDLILPFERKEVKINAYADGFFWPRKENLNIQYNDKADTVEITIVPAVFASLENPVITLGLGAGFVTLALVTGSLLVFWSRRGNPVRR